MIPWNDIETVLLDLDGTLLDLNFDTYFWQEHVPLRYSERHGLSLAAARAEVVPKLNAMRGTLEWYCLDYWTRELGLPIGALKLEVEHLIAVHPEVDAFLAALRVANKRVVLVTNAHVESLNLKLDKTQLRSSFDAVYCSHSFGMPKEVPDFWERFAAHEPFDRERSVLIDDNVDVLRSARRFGIRHLIDVLKPDSQKPAKSPAEFPAIASFNEIMPGDAAGLRT